MIDEKQLDHLWAQGRALERRLSRLENNTAPTIPVYDKDNFPTPDHSIEGQVALAQPVPTAVLPGRPVHVDGFNNLDTPFNLQTDTPYIFEMHYNGSSGNGTVYVNSVAKSTFNITPHHPLTEISTYFLTNNGINESYGIKTFRIGTTRAANDIFDGGNAIAAPPWGFIDGTPGSTLFFQTHLGQSYIMMQPDGSGGGEIGLESTVFAPTSDLWLYFRLWIPDLISGNDNGLIAGGGTLCRFIDLRWGTSGFNGEGFLALGA